MAAAADVPGRYDVVIDSQGYCLLDSLEPSLPFRTHRAIYQFSPTFIPRQNVTGAYGDNQQMFWQTASQHDWSLGEQQRYFRSNDTDRIRRYWAGTNVDIHIPGQVSLRNGTVTTSAITSTAQIAAGNQLYVTTATNLYTVDADGTLTDKGAHGLGAAPSTIAFDGVAVYLSTTATGSVGVRKYVSAAFSTFSSQKCDSIAFLNNSLYGVNNGSGILVRFSSGGASSTLFTWKRADGTANGSMTGQVRAYGGQLLIMWSSAKHGTELWMYNSVGTSLLAALPPNFYGSDVDVSLGGIFVGGAFLLTVPTGSVAGSYVPAVMYYLGGNYGELWRAAATLTSAAGTALTDLQYAALGYYDKGIVFVDPSNNQAMLYDASTGALSSVADTSGYTSKLFVDGAQAFVGVNNRSNIRLFHSTGTVSSGTLTTSLFDLESSLPKLFRGVIVDADIPAGASVDIAYQLNSVDGAFTTLQTGITSGTEYVIGQQARSISFKITLNKGSSSTGPVLKRIYVRSAPILQQFRQRQYVLDCSGDARNPRRLRDDSPSPKTGRQMVDDLITASQQTSPFSITDRLGTFTGLIDIDQGFEIYESHPATGDPSRSGTFVARVSVREV